MINNNLGDNLFLLQVNPDYAVKLDSNSDFHGWLFTRYYKGGEWVTVRKLQDWEIQQAEDQRDDGHVIHSPNVRG